MYRIKKDFNPRYEGRARRRKGLVRGGGERDGERLPRNETTVSRSLLGSLIILESARTSQDTRTVRRAREERRDAVGSGGDEEQEGE